MTSPIKNKAQWPGVTIKTMSHMGNLYVNITHKIKYGKVYPHGLYIHCGKASNCLKAEAEVIGRLANLAFRYGADVDEVINILEHIKCEPVWNEGVQITSPADAIAKVLIHWNNNKESWFLRRITDESIATDSTNKVALS